MSKEEQTISFYPLQSKVVFEKKGGGIFSFRQRQANSYSASTERDTSSFISAVLNNLIDHQFFN